LGPGLLSPHAAKLNINATRNVSLRGCIFDFRVSLTGKTRTRSNSHGAPKQPMKWNIVIIASPFPNPSIRSEREAHPGNSPWRNQPAIVKKLENSTGRRSNDGSQGTGIANILPPERATELAPVDLWRRRIIAYERRSVRCGTAAMRARLRTLCHHRCCIHPPRHDPHHAQAACCNPLVIQTSGIGSKTTSG
jgi:hypothetical protein